MSILYLYTFISSEPGRRDLKYSDCILCGRESKKKKKGLTQFEEGIS